MTDYERTIPNGATVTIKNDGELRLANKEGYPSFYAGRMIWDGDGDLLFRVDGLQPLHMSPNVMGQIFVVLDEYARNMPESHNLYKAGWIKEPGHDEEEGTE